MVMSDDSIPILGAGPAGLLAGIELARRGYQTVIYDPKRMVGRPQHCTGVVSPSFIDFTGLPGGLILSRFRGVVLEIAGEVFQASTSAPKAYAIDRVGYEEWLYRVYVDLGGKARMGTRAMPTGIHVDATGAATYIRDGVGEALPALQLIVRASSQLEDGHVFIWWDREVNPYFFSWIVPLSQDRFKVGTAGKAGLWRVLNRLMDRRLGRYEVLRRMYGFVVLGGPRDRFRSGDKVYIGDSAGQVKPSTGGGLMYHALAAKMLAERIGGAIEYSDLFYSMLGREITLQKILRKMFLLMSNEEARQVFTVLSKREVLNMALMYGDMDFHASILVKMVMDMDLMRILGRLGIRVFTELFRGL